MTKGRGLTHGAAFLFLLLLAANLYVFFTREWESSYSPTSYATLYYPLDIPTFREWELVDRNRMQLNLACTDEITEWKIPTDGGHPLGCSGARIMTTQQKMPFLVAGKLVMISHVALRRREGSHLSKFTCTALSPLDQSDKL